MGTSERWGSREISAGREPRKLSYNVELTCILLLGDWTVRLAQTLPMSSLTFSLRVSRCRGFGAQWINLQPIHELLKNQTIRGPTHS